MLTLTHIADTHLGHRQYGLKQREDDMVSTTRAAFREMVEEHDTDAVLLPGDLFHSRDLRPKVLDQAEQELSRLPDDVPVLVSRGNHDENLTPREVTWLNYLHRRGHIVFLKADLEADPETARVVRVEPSSFQIGLQVCLQKHDVAASMQVIQPRHLAWRQVLVVVSSGYQHRHVVR